MESQGGQWFAYTSWLYAACVLSPAKSENLEDVWLLRLLFFWVLHNNYQVFWHSLDSEGLRFRNMHFLHLSSLTHSLPSLRMLSRSSLSSHSFSVCFTSVLTWSWKRAQSLGVRLFGLFLSLCGNFLSLRLNLNLTVLVRCEHACRHMHIDTIFLSLCILCLAYSLPVCSGKTLYYLFTFSTDWSPSMIREFFSAP